MFSLGLKETISIINHKTVMYNKIMSSDDNGRPEYPEEQYHTWFDELAPFFKLGETLNAAIDDAGLQQHRTTLYKKSKLNDWFLDRMQSLQAIPGKLANNILVKRLMAVDEKIKQGLPPTEEEMKDVRFIAERHRSAHPYFVNRSEVILPPQRSMEEIEAELEENVLIDDVAEHAALDLELERRRELEKQGIDPGELSITSIPPKMEEAEQI